MERFIKFILLAAGAMLLLIGIQNAYAAVHNLFP